MKKRAGKKPKVVITAGPTVEPIDPVRYISNFSTGTMGYEIARACRRKGYDTRLISGPVSLIPPEGVRTTKVMTAGQMKKAVMREIRGCDCLVMAAAVCDFRPAVTLKRKIKKSDRITLEFIKNPDILGGTGKKARGVIRVGFALETDNAARNAASKLKDKDLDLIVVNEKRPGRDPFGGGKKKFTLVDRKLRARLFANVTKQKMAAILADEIERLMR